MLPGGANTRQDHRKTDHKKRERRGAISQSDAHISMLSRVNKKTDRYPERVKKSGHPRMTDSKIKHLLNDVIGHLHMYRKQYHIYRDKPQLFGYKKKLD